MTTHQHQHQGATDASSPPSWPSAAGPPTAAPAGDDDAAGGAITVAGAIVIFVAISIGLLSLKYCFDAWDREEIHAARPRRRRRRGGDNGTAGSTNGGGGGVRSRGVDPELLRALPVTVYRRAAAPGSKDDDGDAVVECSVCLAEMDDGEEARFLPRCGHGFHAECVDMWLASHTTCPLCRLTVVSMPDDPESSPETPAPASALRPLPPEPANLLPGGSVVLVVSGQGAVAAATMTAADDDGDDDTAASASTAAAGVAALVIEIPELAVAAPVPTAPTPRDAAKSPPVSARPPPRPTWSRVSVLPSA